MLSTRINELRKDNNLTQEEFGKKIGLKKSSISLIEKGTSGISDGVFKNIVSEFCVNESWLKEGIGEKYNVTLRKKQEFLENELNFLSTTYYDRQSEFFAIISTFDDEKRSEVLSTIEEIYKILNEPLETKRFGYFSVVSSLLLELNKYFNSLKKGQEPDKDYVTSYIKSFKEDIINATSIILPDWPVEDYIEDSSYVNEFIGNQNLSDEENYLISVYRNLPESDKLEIKTLLSIKQERLNKTNKTPQK